MSFLHIYGLLGPQNRRLTRLLSWTTMPLFRSDRCRIDLDLLIIYSPIHRGDPASFDKNLGVAQYRSNSRPAAACLRLNSFSVCARKRCFDIKYSTFLMYRKKSTRCLSIISFQIGMLPITDRYLLFLALWDLRGLTIKLAKRSGKTAAFCLISARKWHC